MSEPDGPLAAAELLASVLTPQLNAELPAAVLLRHELHRNPEVSGSESRTAAAAAAAIGSPDAPEVAGTGRLIRIGPPAGPAICIRAELDALPAPEQTGAAFASVNGAMHACGHDVHLAALIALARAARAAPLPVALLAILQPREEAGPSGALDIASVGRSSRPTSPLRSSAFTCSISCPAELSRRPRAPSMPQPTISRSR